MLKKPMLYCMIFTVLFSFAACKDSLDEALNTDSAQALTVFLTPENAEIISHTDNLIILESEQTVPELILFYEDVFNKLGLNEYEIDDEQDGIWIFSGVYKGIHNHIRDGGYDNETDNRERPIIVELRASDESVDVEIIY
jgi:hypothetical protein